MSLKTTIFPSCLNECLSSMLFLPNSSLVNEFILLDRCLYDKKGIYDVSIKKTFPIKRVLSEQYGQYTVKPRYDL
jgi:hypothetical protein